jgi:DNA-binding transcriptional ArsR family regulator
MEGSMNKFTRIPKIPHLIASGVPVEVIPTYAALSDYTNNKTGLCWPKMETLAANLGRSVRTIQRHLHQLQDLGLVDFVERRRWRGRFSGYTYRVGSIAAMIRRKKAASTTGHGRPVGSGPPIVTRTKGTKTPPSTSPTEGYEWLFGLGGASSPENTSEKGDEARSERARRRSEGYEWLFEG